MQTQVQPQPAETVPAALPWYKSQVLGGALAAAILGVLTQVFHWSPPAGAGWLASAPFVTAGVMLLLWGVHVVVVDLARHRSPLHPTAAQAAGWAQEIHRVYQAFLEYVVAHEAKSSSAANSASSTLLSLVGAVAPLLAHAPTPAVEKTAAPPEAATPAPAVPASPSEPPAAPAGSGPVYQNARDGLGGMK